MASPFRNDLDALKTRLGALDDELAHLRDKTRDYEAARERMAEAEREAQEIRRELDARSTRPKTPYLDTLRVASPCNASWDDMIGDDRTRFCASCQKNVHNISAMTRADAEAFLEDVASSVCVRMYRRTDGTILTSDCPVGARKKRVKRLFLATVGGGLTAAAGVLAFWRYEETTVMGEMRVIDAPELVELTADPEPADPRMFATPPPTAVFENEGYVQMGFVGERHPSKTPRPAQKIAAPRPPR